MAVATAEPRYGSGYGDGYGYGDGSGYGDGYGYGDGDGYGYGSGSGDGYGYGYGSGYGSGDGDGSGELLTQAFVEHPTVKTATSTGEKVVLGVWRSDAKGYSANGGTKKTEPARPGLLQEVPGPLLLCSPNALHASTNPTEWSGERWWVVALFEPVQKSGSKIGSLKRLIVEELV